MDNSTAIPLLDDSTRLISIPILKDFLEDEVIGEIRVRSDALPPTPEFLFSIGYRTNAIPGGLYELVCASIVPNDRYHKYLHTKTSTTEALCVKPELGKHERI